MSKVINVIATILFLMCWFWIIKRFIINRYSTVKTVEAEVFDKYKLNAVSKYPGAFKQESCIVVFAAKDKKFSFVVSEFSYNNYKIKDKGMLTYKGNKIISFQ